MPTTPGTDGGGFAFDRAIDRNGVQPLNPAPATKRSPKERLHAWISARRARRELATKNADDLLSRFGAAAPTIARNCARQAIGIEERRLWSMVARKIRRRAPEGLRSTPEW
jgi:hypothetical protein